MSVIGWRGPLIDLSAASSHLDDFVQLVVFVRRSEPVQKVNASKADTLLKTNIQVGDDTRAYFSISIWPKHMGSKVVAGDVILIQNVRIIKFRDILEATTAQISGLRILLHSDDLIASKGTAELVALSHYQLGETTREKLRRVVEWVKHTESAFQHLLHVDSNNKNRQSLKNWKEDEKHEYQNCLSISGVVSLTSSCNANFFACIFDILLGFTWRPNERDKGLMSVSTRLFKLADSKIVEDFVCTGCKLCGSPMSSRNLFDQDKAPLYCPKNTKYLHSVCLVYRPFLLFVQDESGQIPILVHNKAAEILFGGITAENVNKCYQEEQKSRIPNYECDRKLDCANTLSNNSHPIESESQDLTQGNQQFRCAMQADGGAGKKKPNFYRIWLILMKSLLQQGTNSPFRFEIQVDWEKDHKNGRFELASLVMPCYKTEKS